MKTQGKFVFKSFVVRDAGEFLNEDNKPVKYNGCYVLKVDEINEKNEPNERKFKVSLEQKSLIEKLKNVKLYEPVTLFFDVVLYTNSTKLELKDVELIKEGKQYGEYAA